MIRQLQLHYYMLAVIGHLCEKTMWIGFIVSNGHIYNIPQQTMLIYQ